MKVLTTAKLPPEALDLLRSKADLVLEPTGLPKKWQELLPFTPGVHGILSLLTWQIGAELIYAIPDLKAISNDAAGLDNIDLKTATQRKIVVTHTPDLLTHATADLTWALILGIARRISEGERFVRKGLWKGWEPQLLLGHDLWGKALGVIGLGRIGLEVAKRAKGFGMKIFYHSQTPKISEEEIYGFEYKTLPELLTESDYLTLHTPSTPQTRGLIGEKELKQMKSTAFLINTARGTVVDSMALTLALKEGWIAGAALDVTDPEPIPSDHPLLTLENCLIVPHIGSATVETRRRMALQASEDLLTALEGSHPKFVANPEVFSEDSSEPPFIMKGIWRWGSQAK
ncbi:MAG: D-glycerate dehydrogenase [Deltaproteobacteria bacterium]|nr:D-glycerate dehydrogenase [Deltaproteobacteria bacterium]